MSEDADPETKAPEAVELRYPPITVAGRVAMALILSIGASLLMAGFMQVALAQAAARVGETALLAVWSLCVTLFTALVWWQSTSFLLRADAEGILQAAGRERTVIKWSDLATAVANAPTQAGGQEYAEGTVVILRDGEGRKRISLAHDIRRGLPAGQVSEFKQYVRAQLNAHNIAREGPAVAWINWE